MQQTYGYGYYKRTKGVRTGIIVLSLIQFTFYLGVNIDGPDDFFRAIYPLNIIASLTVLLSYQKQWNLRAISALFIIYISGFLLEFLGMKLLLIYYHYPYFRIVLGPKMADVPMSIGIYWVVLIYCVGVMIKDVKIDIFTKCAIGSVMIVLFDIIMEPAARKLYFWDFKYHIVPIENYIAWFIASYFLLLFFLNIRAKVRNGIAPYVFIILFVYFLLIDMFYPDI